MDKTLTNAIYDIEIDEKTYLPTKIRVLVMAGTRDGTEREGRKIVGGKHVAMHFTYDLKDFGEIEKPEIPKPAAKLIAAR